MGGCHMTIPGHKTVCFRICDMEISNSKNRCYTEKKMYSATTLSLATKSKIKNPRVQC